MKTNNNIFCPKCGKNIYFKIITIDTQIGRNVFFLKKAICNRCNSQIKNKLCDKINLEIISKEVLSTGR